MGLSAHPDDNAWQHLPEPKLPLSISVPPGVAPFELIVGVLKVLQEDHGATVMDVDLRTDGGVVTLKIPADAQHATGEE
jgi:hypothetical protein